MTQANIHKTICVAGYTGRVRHVTESTRDRVYHEYGVTGPHPFPAWEVDHLIPLELGGANAISNLWPEHHPADKGALENRLHAEVCAGELRLRKAQRIMATD